MDFDSALWWVLGIAVLVATFRAGQEYERDEAAPRRRQAAILKTAVEDRLHLVAHIYMVKGPEAVELEETIKSVAVDYPEVYERWRSSSEAERQKLGEQAAKVFADPVAQAAMMRRVEDQAKLFDEASHALADMLRSRTTS